MKTMLQEKVMSLAKEKIKIDMTMECNDDIDT